jgi:membrane-associated protein
MNEQVLAFFSQYGAPALFGIVAIASVGVPLPVTLLLVITGSMAAQGTLRTGSAIAIATAASVAGDQLGFAIGRWGSKALIGRFKGLLGHAEHLRRLEKKAKEWGGAGVFLSRWLVTPLGPWINFASGAGDYPWLQFTLWDLLGEALFATIYIGLGRIFSDHVQEIGSVLGDLTWAIVGILAAALLGWKLFQNPASTQPVSTASESGESVIR